MVSWPVPLTAGRGRQQAVTVGRHAGVRLCDTGREGFRERALDRRRSWILQPKFKEPARRARGGTACNGRLATTLILYYSTHCPLYALRSDAVQTSGPRRTPPIKIGGPRAADALQTSARVRCPAGNHPIARLSEIRVGHSTSVFGQTKYLRHPLQYINNFVKQNDPGECDIHREHFRVSPCVLSPNVKLVLAHMFYKQMLYAIT